MHFCKSPLVIIKPQEYIRMTDSCLLNKNRTYKNQIIEMVACFHLIMINNYILVNASNILLKTTHILNFFGTWRMEKILI